MQIAANVNQPVPTTYAQSEADLTTARVGTIDQAGKETPMENSTPTGTMAAQTPQHTPAPAENTADRVATPAPEPQATPAATPVATPAATPVQTLPATASPYPLLGFAGLIALAGFGVLTFAAKRS
jgi:hypothetical protein